METSEIEQLIESAINGAAATAVDLTGTKDHFRVEVIAADFAGKTLLEQHRMVQSCVQSAIDDGRIHAISFLTRSSEA